MLLSEVAATSVAVARTSARLAKIEAIAGLLARVPADEVKIAAAFLSGDLTQRQIGVGYAALVGLPEPARPAAAAQAVAADQERPEAASDAAAAAGGAAEAELVQAVAAGAGPDAAAAAETELVQAASAGGADAGGAAETELVQAVAAADAGSGPASQSSLTLTETDAAFERIGQLTGPGSQAARRELLARLIERATADERQFLFRLLAGDLRQGALEGVMIEAVAKAAGVPGAEVRRAHQLRGSLPEVAQAALAAAAWPSAAIGSAAAGPKEATGSAPAQNTADPSSVAGPNAATANAATQNTADPSAVAGPNAATANAATQNVPDQSPADRKAAVIAVLRSFTLRVGRPVRPMLAASAPDLEAALAKISPAILEWKIDGIRIQVHRSGDQVRVFTRTLDDITDRVPEIAAMARSVNVHAAVIDGEAVALRPDGRPHPFQVTSARMASQQAAPAAASAASGRSSTRTAAVPLTAFLFDLLHVDGQDLIELPATERFARLKQIAPGGTLIPHLVTGDQEQAAEFFADALGHGHEGVVVKAPDSTYGAGRRGSDWIKVKPRTTLDLVILAAEWGHGRRTGWLSNLHLGARDPDRGGFVMLGKTFKGLTDAMLRWQTGRLLELADPPQQAAVEFRPGESGDAREAWRHGVVRVRPELVAEIAFDGVQASRRYPGGVTLRFARVLRYREDKTAAEADTLEMVRALWPHGAEDAG